MERRKPTYGSAIRMAELVLLLSKAWRPVPVKRICDYLRISHRTAQRYRSSLNQNLHAEGGGELVRVLRQDGIRLRARYPLHIMKRLLGGIDRRKVR